MSALGERQTFRVARAMSALPLKADIRTAKSHVRFAPHSDQRKRIPANGHVRFTPESGHVRCTSSMSALGQYRTNAVQQKGSLDHLVGPQQKRRRNGYPQRVSSSHVDHRFEFRRPFDRQFTRIGPSRDLTSKDTCQPIQAE
jgi:hypothetical protein